MEVYKSEYLKIDVESANSLLFYTWFPASENMDDAKFESEATKIADEADRHKVKNVIGHDRDFMFPISPDVQVWIAENLLSRLPEIGVKKYAIIQSEDLLVQMSSEQMFQEDVAKQYQSKYFSSEKEAREWVK